MGREGPEGAGDTHITQVQKLGLAGQAEEGRADDQVNLQKGAVLSACTVGWGVQPYLPSTLTCRVGSKEARWASCSLKALSFSSYWLGRGQARL